MSKLRSHSHVLGDRLQHHLEGTIQPVTTELHVPAHFEVRPAYMLYHDWWNMSRTNVHHFSPWSRTAAIKGCAQMDSPSVWGPESLWWDDLIGHHEQEINFPCVKSLRIYSCLLLYHNQACWDRYKNWYLKVECFYNKNLNYVVLA